MSHIVIISASVREGRMSHRVALYLQKFIQNHQQAKAEILDLKEYNFPVFNERLKNLKEIPETVKSFAEKIQAADGIIFVTPEYNGGYPASLKNVIDLLYTEWQKKPLAIATVSSGAFGGSQVITSLAFTMFKIGAVLVPATFYTAKVQDKFKEDGSATDPEATDKHASTFIDMLMWLVDKLKS